ncbi:MAG TPA: ferritin-like domain-containing protein [Gemmatimonadaceae bacterium]
MELDSLRALYVEELKDLYSAETQIMKALPRMIRAAEHPQLKRAFEKHLRVTERQAKRLEKICKALGEKPTGKKCVGMEGLIKEAKELISEKPEPEVLDAGLISAAQHVEHYEMAGYGTVRTYARELGYDDQADLLQMTLDEEQQTDEELTLLAESSINLEAIVAGDDEEEEATRRGGARKKGGAKKSGARKKSVSRARKNLVGA